jgi:preprotein translocase subunit SecA
LNVSFDLAQSLDEEDLKRLIGKTGLKVMSALHRVLPKAAIPFHYALVAQRRRRLERIQRNRRLKLRKTEEKRNENLIFTRAD